MEKPRKARGPEPDAGGGDEDERHVGRPPPAQRPGRLEAKEQRDGDERPQEAPDRDQAAPLAARALSSLLFNRLWLLFSRQDCMVFHRVGWLPARSAGALLRMSTKKQTADPTRPDPTRPPSHPL